MWLRMAYFWPGRCGQKKAALFISMREVSSASPHPQPHHSPSYYLGDNVRTEVLELFLDLRRREKQGRKLRMEMLPCLDHCLLVTSLEHYLLCTSSHRRKTDPCISIQRFEFSITRVLSPISRVQLFVTPCTAAHQAPLSMETVQARILEWVAMPSSRGSSRPRDLTCHLPAAPALLVESLPLSYQGRPLGFILYAAKLNPEVLGKRCP